MLRCPIINAVFVEYPVFCASICPSLTVFGLNHTDILNALDAKERLVFLKDPVEVLIYLLPCKKLSAVVPEEYVGVPEFATKL